MKINFTIVCLFFIIVLLQCDIVFCQSVNPFEIKKEKARPVEDAPVEYMRDVVKQADKHFQKTKTGYKQYKRMEYYAMSRLGRDGRLVNTSALNYKAYNDYIQSTSHTSSRVFSHNGSWDFIGPTSTIPDSLALSGGIGRVNRLAFHPTDPNIVFAATAGGGLWKTLDKGLHWQPLSDGIPVMCTTGVAVDFTDPDILYLLTGDGSFASFHLFNEFSRSSIGVFKSYDGGNLWQPTGLSFDENALVEATNLYMSPEDRFTLYACTDIGLFRTLDGGNTWNAIRNGRIYELEFKPGDAERIYCVDDSWVYVSDDGGDTWIDSTMIPAVDGATGRMCISTCVSNPDLVYLIASPVDTLKPPTDTLPNHRGLWRSVNSGSDFNLVTTRPNILAKDDGDEFKSQAWYDFGMECNPQNASQILVGAIGMWKSIDSGSNWTYDNGINMKYHADVQCVQANPLDNALYLGTDGGVFVSFDFGNTYAFRSGYLAITQYYKVANSPFFTDYVLAGAQDNGVHLRDDVETLFDHVLFGDGMKSLFHPTAASLVISSCQEGQMVISHDTGHTFQAMLPAIKDNDSTEWTTPMAFDANDQFTIYIGYKPILKSTDQGETFFATSNDTISAHKILENNVSYPGRLYAGDCKNCDDSIITFEMYRSLNYGATWQRIDGNPGFPSTSFVTAAALNPDDSLEIWITCGRYDAVRKVYRSMDSGNTWANKTGSLPNVPVNGIVFEDNNGNSSGAVYVATDIGVFYRNDDLGDWIYFSNNLPRVEVTDLDIDYNGGLIRAATYGRGLWESELYTSCQPTIILNPLNQPIGRSFVHQASQQIFSTALVDGAGSRVVYKSDGEIYLSEGFHATAKKGATFNGVLGTCGAGGIESPLTGDKPVRKQ